MKQKKSPKWGRGKRGTTTHVKKDNSKSTLLIRDTRGLITTKQTKPRPAASAVSTKLQSITPPHQTIIRNIYTPPLSILYTETWGPQHPSHQPAWGFITPNVFDNRLVSIAQVLRSKYGHFLKQNKSTLLAHLLVNT